MELVELVIGRNYHTSWQSRKGMRFKLIAINEDSVKLKTNKSCFWCKHKELINVNRYK